MKANLHIKTRKGEDADGKQETDDPLSEKGGESRECLGFNLPSEMSALW